MIGLKRFIRQGFVFSVVGHVGLLLGLLFVGAGGIRSVPPEAMTVEIVPSNEAPPIETRQVEGTPLELDLVRVGGVIRFRKGERHRGAAPAQIGRTVAATSASPFEPAAQRQPGGRTAADGTACTA